MKHQKLVHELWPNRECVLECDAHGKERYRDWHIGHPPILSNLHSQSEFLSQRRVGCNVCKQQARD